jgi:hypothetical protein
MPFASDSELSEPAGPSQQEFTIPIRNFHLPSSLREAEGDIRTRVPGI